MPHEFMLFPGIDEGSRAIEDTCAFLRAHLSKEASTPRA
jgi:hypothetical protein